MKTKLKTLLAIIWGSLFKRKLSIGALPLRVLCYHSVNSIYSVECDPIHPELFEDHIQYICANYEPVGIDEIIEHLNGTKLLNEKSVLITFDDGYVDNFVFAYPILQKYNCPAVIFLVSNFVNQEFQLINKAGWSGLSWEQVNKMLLGGLIEFGAHTKTHRILSSIDTKSVAEEIVGSITEIENKIDKKVRTFAFPNGRGEDKETC